MTETTERRPQNPPRPFNPAGAMAFGEGFRFMAVERLLVNHGYPKRGVRGRFNKMTDQQVNELIRAEDKFHTGDMSYADVQVLIDTICGKRPKVRVRTRPEQRVRHRALDLEITPIQDPSTLEITSDPVGELRVDPAFSPTASGPVRTGLRRRGR